MSNIINYPKNTNKINKEIIDSFIKKLQKKYPLDNQITIDFLEKRTGTMTTGSRTNKGRLKIFVKDRIISDVLRTLGHEWIHEYQRNTLNRDRGKSIGGKNENEANAKSGEILKYFAKNKENEKKIYKPFLKKIEEVELKLNEDLVSQKNIISEIKKISIEKLQYDFNDLETFIDSETMKTHYNKHYKGYVEKLNVELEKVKGPDLDIEQIIKKISKYNTVIKNNGGGAFNHALFWKMLSPKKQEIKDPIKSKIEKTFGSYEIFKEKFEEESKSRFGSGWVWLILTKTNNLKIVSTSNQDNPLMNTEKIQGYPLLGLDVWEHAYYLKYKNQRDKYVKNFWKVVNWGFVNDQYTTQLERNKVK
jgi:Fe-Mn family superoxide dismutase